MSVWIGDLGAMVETPCLSGLDIDRPDQTIRLGGPGTLAPPSAVMWGPSHRVWSCALDAKSPGGLAALETLIYRQHRYGGRYRLLACEAHQTNLFTPAAAMDFSGWTGPFTVSTMYTASYEMAGGGTVLYPNTPLEARTPLEGGPPVVQVDSVAAITVTALASATLVSPIVPVRPGYPVTAGVFAQGSAVQLSARWVDAAGEPISTVPLVSTSHPDLRRLAPSTLAPASAAGVRLVLTGGTRYAWPSVTWTAGPRRFATGRGAEAVELSSLPESVIRATRDHQLSAFRYSIREVST